MGVLAYSPLTGGWLSGRYRKDGDNAGPTSRPAGARRPVRPIAAREPAQARRGRAALASSPTTPDLTLIQLAIGFVLEPPRDHVGHHRTADHGAPRGQLAAADVALDEAILDRIDEIVAPGITINPADNSFINPELEPAARRRPAQSDAQLLAR